MNATILYGLLEAAFIAKTMSDSWAKYMSEVGDYLCGNFMHRSMGLVCDNASEIEYVYTAVFPEKSIMQAILDSGQKNALLFVHHPSVWSYINAKFTYVQMERKLLQEFKNRNISIYCLHVPLDAFGNYSTGVTLANALGFDIESSFGQYRGAECGVIAKTNLHDVHDLTNVLSRIIGHSAKLYSYGGSDNKNGSVAILPGGGNDIAFIKEVYQIGVNTVIVGVSSLNQDTYTAHEFEKDKGINLIGGTHYSTEKFACEAMCSFFHNIGIQSVFIPGNPLMLDL